MKKQDARAGAMPAAAKVVLPAIASLMMITMRDPKMGKTIVDAIRRFDRNPGRQRLRSEQ